MFFSLKHIQDTNVACTGDKKGHTGFWWGNLREKDHLEDLDIDRRIILKCIFKKWNGGGINWIDWRGECSCPTCGHDMPAAGNQWYGLKCGMCSLWQIIINFCTSGIQTDLLSTAVFWNVDVENVRWQNLAIINPYPTAFPYGNGMVLHFYQQQESSMTKTVHRVINKGLKTYV